MRKVVRHSEAREVGQNTAGVENSHEHDGVCNPLRKKFPMCVKYYHRSLTRYVHVIAWHRGRSNCAARSTINSPGSLVR